MKWIKRYLLATLIIVVNGFEGQRVFIIPSRKAIIVRMGQTITGNFEFEGFVRDILSTFPQDK